MQGSTGIRGIINWCRRKRHLKRRLEIKYCLTRMLKRQFYRNMGYELNLNDPKTLNEKLQWFKVYVRDPRITMCADKYVVRNYVEEKSGSNIWYLCMGCTIPLRKLISRVYRSSLC